MRLLADEALAAAQALDQRQADGAPLGLLHGVPIGIKDLLYTEGVEEVKKYVFNNRLDTVFLKPKLGDSAGVFGAALLE